MQERADSRRAGRSPRGGGSLPPRPTYILPLHLRSHSTPTGRISPAGSQTLASPAGAAGSEKSTGKNARRKQADA